MATNVTDEAAENAPIYFEETVVKVNRCAKVVKGGRRFSFSALVVIGNRGGAVAVGFGKAKEVPSAVAKAVKAARKDLKRIPRVGTTIPHPITGRYGAAMVKLIPAAPGTGIIAGAASRAVLEYAGITDVLTKSIGSPNPINLVKATMDGLLRLRSKEEIGRLRGVTIS